MTISEEKRLAYEKLHEAVESLRKAYGYEDDFLTGYILLTSSVQIVPESESPDGDDMDVKSASGWYSKRGQDPTLSYGILCEAVRHYNEVQTEYGESD